MALEPELDLDVEQHFVFACARLRSGAGYEIWAAGAAGGGAGIVLLGLEGHGSQIQALSDFRHREAQELAGEGRDELLHQLVVMCRHPLVL